MSLFGVPFLLAGVYVALAAMGLVQIEPAPTQGWVLLVFALMSLVFLGAGGILLFGRRWVMLNVGSGSLVRSTGLLVPAERVPAPGGFNAVVIALEPGDSDSSDHYPVRLRAICEVAAAAGHVWRRTHRGR